MKNPIQRNDFFATPESMDALMFNQEQYAEAERAAFTIGMMLTWNYLSAQLDKMLEAEARTITLVLGETASRKHNDGENRPCRLAQHGNLETYTFSTPEDLSEALTMMADFDGFMGYTEFDPAEQELPANVDVEEDWDDTQATEEGWAIFEAHGTDDLGMLRIERIDEAAIFDGDPAAWHYVVSRARAGSEYHQRALQIVAEDNPTERDEIREATGYLF